MNQSSSQPCPTISPLLHFSRHNIILEEGYVRVPFEVFSAYKILRNAICTTPTTAPPHPPGRLFILTGPYASGKTTILHRLRQDYTEANLHVILMESPRCGISHITTSASFWVDFGHCLLQSADVGDVDDAVARLERRAGGRGMVLILDEIMGVLRNPVGRMGVNKFLTSLRSQGFLRGIICCGTGLRTFIRGTGEEPDALFEKAEVVEVTELRRRDSLNFFYSIKESPNGYEVTDDVLMKILDFINGNLGLVASMAEMMYDRRRARFDAKFWDKASPPSPFIYFN